MDKLSAKEEAMSWTDLDQTWHYVEKWAAKKPGAEALVFENERLNWGQFKEQMDLVAKAFLEAGIQRGDRVAMLSMARPEFMTTYMAAGKVGAVWLGLSPKFTLDELRYLIGSSRPAVLTTLREYMGDDLSETVKTLQKEFDCLKKVLVIGEPFEGAESFADFTGRPRPELNPALEERAKEGSPDDEALLMYTSGSTGKPKGVLHTHGSILANIGVQVKKFFMDEDMRILLHFPINHAVADTELGLGSVMAGGCLVLMDRFDPAGTLEIIIRERITGLGQLPVMFLLEFKEPTFPETDFSDIDTFIWAGAAAPQIMIDVLSNICEKTGATMLTGYGSTETAGFITYTKKGDDLKTLVKSAGKIAEPFELKIVDSEHREVPDGRVGEMAVRGPFLMKEYYNNPEATAEAIDEEGWFYTSDLAYKDERGYIYISGRSSEMYKTGGENVFPREIEDVLESHTGVLFAAVIGMPDELYQEVGWAFVMSMPGHTPPEEELRELCKSSLANFKVPKRFFVRPLLPLLPNGKINKMALKKEATEMTGGGV
ncbi:MAG: acyl--CoA ligase [Candidatus Abyssubacteria bacterium]|nr:acyl--CoA ligase [Candidatus Abyssubacteria bacterium]